jgi:NAD-dependent SIR2 family protein deacetylase
MICEKCGQSPKSDKKDSNENWSVYPTVCPKCGGKINPKIIDGKKGE